MTHVRYDNCAVSLKKYPNNDNHVVTMFSTLEMPYHKTVAGGLLRDGLIIRQTSKTVRDVMTPKVHGSHHMWKLASYNPLKHFCAFSSVSSIMGSGGQSNYVAANNVLDTMVACLHACGIPGKAQSFAISQDHVLLWS